MNSSIELKNEWNIKTTIGPILLDIFIDYAFLEGNHTESSTKHKHALYEFHFATSGNGILYTNNLPHSISPNSYYIIKPGIYHRQKGLPAENVSRYSFKFDFSIDNNAHGTYLEDEIRHFVYALSNMRFFHSKNLGKINEILITIRKELENEELGYYTKVQHLLSLLFVNVILEFGSEGLYEVKKPSDRHPIDRINIIDKFFDLNFDYKATAEELCKLINISKSQLNRILKDKYNMTFKQKHIEAQIEHIKFMLINTDMPIKSIVESIGYTSESNFKAFFKKETGMSPKAYRSQYK